MKTKKELEDQIEHLQEIVYNQRQEITKLKEHVKEFYSSARPDRIKELEAQVAYEQERNFNNVMCADLRIKELENND